VSAWSITRTSTSSSGIMATARPVDTKLELPRNPSGRHDLKVLRLRAAPTNTRASGDLMGGTARPPELVFHRSHFFLVAHIPAPLIPLSARNTRVFLRHTVYVRDERTFFSAARRGAGWPRSRGALTCPRPRWDFLSAPTGGPPSADFCAMRRDGKHRLRSSQIFSHALGGNIGVAPADRDTNTGGRQARAGQLRP
jgi:hypothetical protein